MFTKITRSTVSDAQVNKALEAVNTLHEGNPITVKELEQKPHLARYVLSGMGRQILTIRNREVKAKKSK